MKDFQKHKDERIQKVYTEKLKYQASLDVMEKEKKVTCLCSLEVIIGLKATLEKE